MPISITELDVIFSLIHRCSSSENVEDFHDVACELRQLLPYQLLLVGIVHAHIDITRKPLPRISEFKRNACLHAFRDIWRTQLTCSPLLAHSTDSNTRTENALNQPSRFSVRLNGIDLNKMLTFYYEPETKLKMRFLLCLSLPTNRQQSIEKYNAIALHLLPYLFSLYRQAFLCEQQNENTPYLTKRELEVLRWAKEGKSAWEISAILAITERTVKFHLSNIFNKLDVNNRYQAIAKAFSFGLLE